jgi:hypothetical protein
MIDVISEIVRFEAGYKAEVSQFGRSIHIVRRLPSESDAEIWVEECRRLVYAEDPDPAS